MKNKPKRGPLTPKTPKELTISQFRRLLKTVLDALQDIFNDKDNCATIVYAKLKQLSNADEIAAGLLILTQTSLYAVDEAASIGGVSQQSREWAKQFFESVSITVQNGKIEVAYLFGE